MSWSKCAVFFIASKRATFTFGRQCPGTSPNGRPWSTVAVPDRQDTATSGRSSAQSVGHPRRPFPIRHRSFATECHQGVIGRHGRSMRDVIRTGTRSHAKTGRCGRFPPTLAKAMPRAHAFLRAVPIFVTAAPIDAIEQPKRLSDRAPYAGKLARTVLRGPRF